MKAPAKLTVALATRLAKLSGTHLRYLADRGDVPVEKTERGLRLFERADIERLAAKRAKQ